ncbi:endolytic transglycosylase MltG [Metaclostridioides mangenotii]|uniref:endolytic transglycosylase MltG n=1 Tax=Metaclostridioides mangenotii TaxID=1540 RepID=UPI0028F11DC7|nr:endolytic transglycosylase MltG [Clostridioides mangenotii]
MIRKGKMLKIVLLSVLVIAVVASVAVVNQIGPYNKKNKTDVLVEIPSGSSISSIAKVLSEKNLIKNEFLFKIVARTNNEYSNVKAGTYLINQGYSNKDILDTLIMGKVHNVGTKIVVPEGATSKEIIATLVDKNLGEKEVFESLVKDSKQFSNDFKFLKEDGIKTLEGFLYPATYYFEEGKISEKEIIMSMLSRFDNIYTQKIKPEREKSKLSLKDIMSMASIIEKEAVLDKDRPIISSVFYNRIKIGMPLQSDATIQYIFNERKKIVTYADLKIDSPYNSYKNKGLPPTPIANPGIGSIEAAINPAKTDYLYFVAKVDGGNNYSKTYEEHLKYVKEYKDDRDKLNKDKKVNSPDQNSNKDQNGEVKQDKKQQ